MTTTINASTSAGLVQTADTSGSLALQTAGTTAVTIDTSQNVGIGTTSPNSKLYIRVATDANLRVTDSSGTLNLSAENNAGSAQVSMKFNGSQMMLANDGSLLVGTTANIGANAKIYAVGSGKGIAVGTGPGSNTFRHLYMNTSDTNLYFFNDANYAYLNGSGAWTNASDARLKKNIVDIKYGLADVLKAQPRSYQMNAVAGDFVGFVAQELQEVIPEVVSGDPEKQLGVDYGSLVAVAFKAIQELKAINDTQAETLSQQAALINALTARIEALENK
jgi:hypothetical protein